MIAVWLMLATACFVGSSLKQIHEEWQTRGLTDTSYTALALLLGGCVARAFAAPSCFAVVPAALAVVPASLFWLKARDWVHTKWKIR